MSLVSIVLWYMLQQSEHKVHKSWGTWLFVCVCVWAGHPARKTAFENIGGVGGEGSGSNDVPHTADGGTGGVPVVLISNCICILQK